MQAGTQLQASHRHGTERVGNRQQLEVTVRHLRQRSADSNVIPITTGTVQLRLALRQHKRQLAPVFLLMQAGTQFQA